MSYTKFKTLRTKTNDIKVLMHKLHTNMYQVLAWEERWKTERRMGKKPR